MGNSRESNAAVDMFAQLVVIKRLTDTTGLSLEQLGGLPYDTVMDLVTVNEVWLEAIHGD